MPLISSGTSAGDLAMFVVDASVWVSSFLTSDVTSRSEQRSWVPIQADVTGKFQCYAPTVLSPCLRLQALLRVVPVTDRRFCWNRKRLVT